MEDWRSSKHFSRSYCASWRCRCLFRKHHANYAACRLDFFLLLCSMTIGMLVRIDHTCVTLMVVASFLCLLFTFRVYHSVATLTALYFHMYYYAHIPTGRPSLPSSPVAILVYLNIYNLRYEDRWERRQMGNLACLTAGHVMWCYPASSTTVDSKPLMGYTS